MRAIAGKPAEISDRFYQNLAFGTGGLRGILGAGTNRMNIYTVCKATQGLANYLNKHGAVSYTHLDVYKRQVLAKLAAEIWREHYTPLLGPAQVAYMVDKFQSEAAIRRQLEQEHYRYYFFRCEGELSLIHI